GIERVAPMLHFGFRGVTVRITAIRQDVPPKLESIRYEIRLNTDEPEQRIALLHANVRKYGTVFNTVAPGTDLQGTMERGPPTGP
ncbi:MAG: OsmC family peroxiredoxin, partial [Gemmatimonadaceae bacterium]